MISRWGRYHIRLPLLQIQLYTEWDIHASREILIMVNPSYSDIFEELGVPKTTIWRNLDVIFPPLKCSSLKHLWYLIAVGKVKRKIVREVIRLKKLKNWKSLLPS